MQNELTKPSALRDLLSRHGFSFKKQLGQNFLVDAGVLEQIVEAAALSGRDGAFEIGPGAGVVTRLLADRAAKVVAVEKDEALRQVLAETVGGAPNVDLRYADVLDLDLGALWREAFADVERVSVVANLPYYVTTPILFHLFDAQVPIRRIVVMVQKEVADRMMAPPGGKEYGVLSIAVQYRADVQKVTVVRPASFLPPPGVDSMVVCLHCRATPPVNVVDEAGFFRVVRAAFSTRRKTLANALAGGLGLSKQQTLELLDLAQIDPTRRGETLDLAEFAKLGNAFTRIRSNLFDVRD